MKKMLFWLLIGAMSLTTACDKSDGNELAQLEKNHPEVVEALMIRYPAAKVLDVDYDYGMAEIDILDNNKRREVWFSIDGTWQRTTTDLAPTDLPTVVRQAWEGSEFGSYRIEELDLIETPDESFYLFELVLKGKPETHLKITVEGVII